MPATSMSRMGSQFLEHFLPTVSATTDDDDAAASEDEDDYTPALPPELAAARKVAGPSSKPRWPSPSPLPSLSRKVIGPTFPPARPGHGTDVDVEADSSSDSDVEVGPKPLPADVPTTTVHELSGVEEFLEREARRRKNVEEAQQPKKLVREEWMLVPPKAGDPLGSLDPTRLRPRQFGRSTAPARGSDTSLWTETPAERQQRLADEVSGRKRRAANAEPEQDEEEAKKRRRRDAAIRRGVDEHTRRARGPALVDAHMEREAEKKDADELPAAMWDHSRDMSLGGRLMDDKQRQKLLQDAKGLGDRFGTGKSGSFL